MYKLKVFFFILSCHLFDGDGRTPIFFFVEKRKADGSRRVDVRVEEWRNELHFLEEKNVESSLLLRVQFTHFLKVSGKLSISRIEVKMIFAILLLIYYEELAWFLSDLLKNQQLIGLLSLNY